PPDFSAILTRYLLRPSMSASPFLLFVISAVLLRQLLQMLDVSLRTVFRRSLNVQVIGQQLVHLENELRGRRVPVLDCGVGHRIGHLRQFIESVPNNLTL